MGNTREIDVDLLEELVNIPSPTGFEQPAQSVVRSRFKDLADSVTTDVLGNVTGVLNPSGYPRIILAGHVDEVGLQVKHITEKGFIYFHMLGGIDAHITPGCRITILTNKGEVLGVIGKKAIHLQKPEDRKKIVKLDQQYIDIGATSKEEAEVRGIRIGDAIVFNEKYATLGDTGVVVSRCFDDRVGTFIIAEIMRLLKDKPFDAAVHGVSTVQEEIGCVGAETSTYQIDPQVGIVFDVTHSSDTPDVKDTEFGEVKLGGGPVISRGPNINPILFDLLDETARELEIPIQIMAAPRMTGTDARAVYKKRGGVATVLIGIPNRYMHTMSEIIHLDDVDAIIKLVVGLIQRIKKDTSFIPL